MSTPQAQKAAETVFRYTHAPIRFTENPSYCEETIAACAKKIDAEFSSVVSSEKELGEAYLRVRDLVGAWNTSLGGANRFEVTEAAIQKLKSDLAESHKLLRSATGGIVYLAQVADIPQDQRDGWEAWNEKALAQITPC